MAKWSEAQEWESDWWGTCQNTYGEEEKQIVYARKMGLPFYHDGRSPYNIDMDGKSVIDIGGGPVSLLLKCTGLVRATVVDPLEVPHWVALRYEEAGIMFEQKPAEQIKDKRSYDEAWIYNCLQHTASPKKIVKNALRVAEIVRVFEWIETRINEGHPHSFTANQLDQWLGGEGKSETLKYPTLRGKCYYGIFVGS
jgi:2-polyprenyl-3-methyl-5-hydroxy-6-metoxy-1,4-benzoquinol methylase